MFSPTSLYSVPASSSSAVGLILLQLQRSVQLVDTAAGAVRFAILLPEVRKWYATLGLLQFYTSLMFRLLYPASATTPTSYLSV